MERGQDSRIAGGDIDNWNKRGTVSRRCQPIPRASQHQNQIGSKRRPTMPSRLAGGGNARHAVKALIVANEFLEGQAAELQAAVSNGHVRLPRDRKNWYD
jgi:hypothetical protein